VVHSNPNLQSKFEKTLRPSFYIIIIIIIIIVNGSSSSSSSSSSSRVKILGYNWEFTSSNDSWALSSSATFLINSVRNIIELSVPITLIKSETLLRLFWSNISGTVKAETEKEIICSLHLKWEEKKKK